MEKSSSIEISFDDLAVLKDGENIRLPLSVLDLNSHIHGVLEIKIKNRAVPHMGYFGRNDVCFSEWLTELSNVREKFRGAVRETYKFDEGEQGQPAFLFERNGDLMYLSIADSEISDGIADPDWQKVEFSYREFAAEFDKLYRNFVVKVSDAAPQISKDWIKNFLPKPS